MKKRVNSLRVLREQLAGVHSQDAEKFYHRRNMHPGRVSSLRKMQRAMNIAVGNRELPKSLR